MIKAKSLIKVIVLSLGAAAASAAPEPTLKIDAHLSTAPVTPVRYGLMTEEINHSYDGGLYAELVQNRAFLDDSQGPAHWSVVQGEGAEGSIALDLNQPLNPQLTASLRLDAATVPNSNSVGVANDGYWGIPVKPQTAYRASFYAKSAADDGGTVTAAIVGTLHNEVFASNTIAKISTKWKRYETTLSTGDIAPTSSARLVLSVNKPGTIWFSLVSLFPPTWENQENGFRPDLMRMMLDLHPAFLRFPGGNFLEGSTIARRFDWRKTIGPVEERAGHSGPWGYRSTDGLGLLEFLNWCEDLKAEPLLAVYAGYSLGGEHIAAGAALEPYVQDALDEIEYVSGDESTAWGARRAKDGHPAPFQLRYVEIGNEDWFDKSKSYDGRFTQFLKAIKDKYPSLKCISTVGNADPKSMLVTGSKPDVLDEHYYRSAATFFRESPTFFSKYDRKGPEIFVGEWATYEDIVPWSPASKKLPPTPSMKAALADAAFMTAMERNSDVVTMQCYAPMFVNVNPGARQWRPNLIGYDGLRVFGSPSYYALKMFSSNRGNEVVKSSLSDTSLHCSVTRDNQDHALILKLVNAQPTPGSVKIEIANIERLADTAAVTTLSAAPTETNSIDDPLRIIPVQSVFHGVSNSFSIPLPANSINVIRLSTR